MMSFYSLSVDAKAHEVCEGGGREKVQERYDAIASAVVDEYAVK